MLNGYPPEYAIYSIEEVTATEGGLIMYEISPVISAQKQQFLVADSIVKNSCMLIADSLKQHRQTWVSYDAFQHFFDLRKVTRLNNNLISNVLLNSLDSTKTHFSADSTSFFVWRVIKHELKENLYPKNGKQDDKSINAIS